MIDQTLLPMEFKVKVIATPEEMWEAIRALRVRGAPAIGIAAAFGLVLGVQQSKATDGAAFGHEVEQVADYLRTARPTAVNLFWALDRMQDRQRRCSDETVAEQKKALHEEAQLIFEDDRRICRQIGEHGAALVQGGNGLLTHCNAGGLATADYGTALAVCFAAQAQGTQFRVFADETRPLLQGSRLTSWELQQAGIDVTLICDNMAGVVMRQGKVDLVVVGADRIAGNGDVANKIGTYTVAVLAREHNIPFYVAAPISTFDLQTRTGDQIPIEERAADEITEGFGTRTAPDNVEVYNPAFDVTPHALVRGIITEHGIIERPTWNKVAQFFQKHGLEHPGEVEETNTPGNRQRGNHEHRDQETPPT
jgi:methylthioribose-1-phosphate isomerase